MNNASTSFAIDLDRRADAINNTYAAAMVLKTFGLVPIKIADHKDLASSGKGYKAPHTDVGSVKKYRTRPPSMDTLKKWFDNDYPGIGVLTGACSGGLEMFEFEGRAMEDGTYLKFLELVEQLGLQKLVTRIADGWSELSPSGGLHLLYLVDQPAKSKAYAKNEDGKNLIEIKSEGGYTVIAPTSGPVHQSGEPYILLSGGISRPGDIARISVDERDQLIHVAELLNRRKTETLEDFLISEGESDVIGWIDDVRTYILSLRTGREWLEHYGWTFVDEHQAYRPGSENKQPHLTWNKNGKGGIHIFTDQASPLTKTEGEQSVDIFHVIAAYDFDGDRMEMFRHYKDLMPKKPIIIMNGRDSASIRDDILRVVSESGAHVFVRDGALVRVMQDEKYRPIIQTLNRSAFQNYALDAARFCFAKQLDDETVYVDTLPGRDYFDLAMNVEDPPFKQLVGFTSVPIIRRDGSIRLEPGYDDETRLVYMPMNGTEIPSIEDTPAADSLSVALDMLTDVVADFPFTDESYRNNAIGMILTNVLRQAIKGQTPMAVITAVKRGTGKGKLADVAGILTTGRRLENINWSSNTEEAEKRLVTYLKEGRSVIAIDNIEGGLKGDVLNTVLTTGSYSARLLGTNTSMNTDVRCSWIATGNNVELVGDMYRRGFKVKLDAGTYRPETRTGFRHPKLEEYVSENRGKLLWACYTLYRNWVSKGRPVPSSGFLLGSFEEWHHTIGGILECAGLTDINFGFDDEAEEEDVHQIQWRAFLLTVGRIMGNKKFTVADFVNTFSQVDYTLWNLPAELARANNDDLPSSKSIGRYFASNAGTPFNEKGLKLVKHKANRNGVIEWSVENADSYQPQKQECITVFTFKEGNKTVTF